MIGHRLGQAVEADDVDEDGAGVFAVAAVAAGDGEAEGGGSCFSPARLSGSAVKRPMSEI
jgi:hypothetical protein